MNHLKLCVKFLVCQTKKNPVSYKSFGNAIFFFYVRMHNYPKITMPAANTAELYPQDLMKSKAHRELNDKMTKCEKSTSVL